MRSRPRSPNASRTSSSGAPFRVASQVGGLSSLERDLRDDLLVAGAEMDGPPALVAFELDKLQIVDSRQPELFSDSPLGHLGRKRVDGPAAIAFELEPAV